MASFSRNISVCPGRIVAAGYGRHDAQYVFQVSRRISSDNPAPSAFLHLDWHLVMAFSQVSARQTWIAVRVHVFMGFSWGRVRLHKLTPRNLVSHVNACASGVPCRASAHK